MLYDNPEFKELEQIFNRHHIEQYVLTGLAENEADSLLDLYTRYDRTRKTQAKRSRAAEQALKNMLRWCKENPVWFPGQNVKPEEFTIDWALKLLSSNRPAPAFCRLLALAEIEHPERREQQAQKKLKAIIKGD